jgi:cellulose synthase/poly-beta-1,6-N-acetylglucosamine synthase-like glycosyltransferase
MKQTDSPGPTPDHAAARPTASVVICAYSERRWADLLRSLQSVTSQQPPPDEIVMVIDHNEPLLRRVTEHVPPGVRVLASTGPPGLSGARNTGVSASTGDIVVFLDDDAFARPGWLGALIETYGPGVIGVGGQAVAAWDEGRPGWFPPEFDWVVGCSYLGLPEHVADVRNVFGANMSFTRDALEKAGAFDRRLGRVGSGSSGAEETELSIRARAAVAGSRILLNPAAVVDHRVPRGRSRLRYFMVRCFGEGKSKAILARVAGGQAALSTERGYVRTVLPAGVLHGIGGLLRGNLDGGRRALAIILGFTATVAGFAWELVLNTLGDEAPG